MKFNFTDLKKVSNYIGFESGIFCTYPNPETVNNGIGRNDKSFCADNEFYRKTYNVKEENLPTWYDPRCRVWYRTAYKKKTTTLSKPYIFATSGVPGITSCVPLWSKTSNNNFRGTYCFDLEPTSRDNKFLQKYYDITQKHVDYLIFSPDEKFNGGKYMESHFRSLV